MKYIGTNIASKNKKKVNKSALVNTPITAASKIKTEIKNPLVRLKIADDERMDNGTKIVVKKIIAREIPSYPTTQLIP